MPFFSQNQALKSDLSGGGVSTHQVILVMSETAAHSVGQGETLLRAEGLSRMDAGA